MKKVIATGLIMLASQVFAQSAATVLFTQKKVVAQHKGGERAITRGSAVEVGEEVITGDSAAANLQYSNGALVSIGENSNYKILAYAPKESVQIKAELSKGKIEIKTPEKIKESLKTPILSLAILGTDVRVYVASPKMTYVQVIEGLVLARNEFLRPGASVRVTADKIVNAPFPKEGEVATSTGDVVSMTTEAGKTVTNDSGSGVDSITYLSTAQVTAISTSVSTQAAQAATIADISLICQIFGTV